MIQLAEVGSCDLADLILSIRVMEFKGAVDMR